MPQSIRNRFPVQFVYYDKQSFLTCKENKRYVATEKHHEAYLCNIAFPKRSARLSLSGSYVNKYN